MGRGQVGSEVIRERCSDYNVRKGSRRAAELKAMGRSRHQAVG